MVCAVILSLGIDGAITPQGFTGIWTITPREHGSLNSFAYYPKVTKGREKILYHPFIMYYTIQQENVFNLQNYHKHDPFSMQPAAL